MAVDTKHPARGRKRLPKALHRKSTSFTLPPAQIEAIFKRSDTIGLPASRFVEYAVNVALDSCDDPKYRAAVLASIQ